MSRIYVLTLALACLLFAAPTTRAAVNHHHLDSKHVQAKKAGTHTHGKTHTGNHTIATNHGPKGKVQSVHVGGAKHEKAHKVKGRHSKSKGPKSASTMGTDRANVLTDIRDDSPESCQDGFVFIAFVVRFGGHTFVILIPIQFVTQTVIDDADPSPPPVPDCGDGDTPEVRLQQPSWESTPTGWSSSGTDIAVLTGSDRRRRS